MTRIGEKPMIDTTKTPFPWFGGKRYAAPLVWSLLGDVAHYVEPFFGGGAVLLNRPHPPNRETYSETVNDIDGYLVNFWRAVRFDPQAVAEHASWPVSELDLHARHVALLEWKRSGAVEKLAGTWDYYDPVVAGWWVWGICCWIGSGFCRGDGPWVRDPDTGKLVKRAVTESAGAVIDDTDDVTEGADVGRDNVRKDGVRRKMPYLDAGRGVARPDLREEGVQRIKPNLSNNGQGVNHARLRMQGIGSGDWREFVERDYAETEEFHPLTMPELRRWMAALSARLRHVRIVCGDWKRVVTPGVLKTLHVRMDDGVCGVFLDPPYLPDVLRKRNRLDLYQAHGDVSLEVREWCKRNGDDPQLRIVLAGFEGEGHEELERYGWRSFEWFKEGYLRGGMGSISKEGHQQHRERLWASPHCLFGDIHQLSLFDAD